jgi:cell division protein FtsA
VKNEVQIKASLDMGTTKISAMIGELRNGVVRVIGSGTTPSEGLKQGVVVDIEKAAESIEQAVREAERMAGLSVKAFNVGVAGEHIRSMNSRGVVAIPNLESEISREDVSRALQAAKSFSIPFDREIIHTIPQEYIVDNQRGIRQPVGMYGARLEARVHVVTAARSSLDNIAKAMLNVGIEPAALVLEPYASSLAVLAGEEKELGVMLIDIGGGTTDVMIFSENGVVASGVIGLGGNNITSDVAYGLRTAPVNAEEIKRNYGCAVSSMISVDEKIEVPGIAGRENKTVSRQLLAGIIEPRVTELLSLIDDQITRSDVKKLLGAGVVLTGGSSMLEGIRELAEQVFNLPVRIGFPRSVEGLVEVVSHPMHATGVGLMLYESDEETKGGEKFLGSKGIRRSLDQLKRAIASFI